MLKLDGATGEVLWSQHYRSPEGLNESVYDIAADADGNAFVTGRQMNGEQGDDVLTMKLAAADGEIVWQRHTSGPSGLDDRGWSIVVGADDHPVITAVMSTAVDPAYYCTQKRDGTSGDEIWIRTLAGAVNHIDRPAGWLSVCDDGDIVMANRTWVTGAAYDVVIQRYAAGNGATVWDSQYNSPTSGPDDPLHMVRDAAGDLLVAGISAGDYMVLKFDGTNGDLDWSAGYDGPTGGYDSAACVIEGPDGEVIVTGFSDGSGTSWDVTTVAFDPVNGDQLWDEAYDPGDAQADEGTALAVSDQGDLYVVGYVYRIASGSDMVALRYGLSGPAGISATAPPARGWLRASPNPFAGRTALEFELPAAGHTRVVVYDVFGRPASVVIDAPLLAGRRQLLWDGSDASGSRLRAGVYFARIESGGLVATRKIVLME